MKKSILACACLAIAAISSTTAQWDPLKVCNARCGSPPDGVLV